MVTEKKFTDLGNSQASLTLTIDAASIEKSYTEKLNEYAKKIEIPGFRKGHTPVSVVERKIGKEVREEVTFNLMEESLKETIQTLDAKEKPLTYSTPELQDEETLLPFKKDSDVTFTVKYDIAPTFELPQYKGLEVEYEDTTAVTDEDVDREIEKFRDQNAIVVNKTTPAEEGDIATVDYKVFEDGCEDMDYSRKDFSFTLGKTYNLFKLDDDIIGMKTGESKETEKTYGEEDAPLDEYRNKTISFSITLTKLKKRELPEVDDDFAMDVKAEYKTVQELRDGIRKDLEEKAEEARNNSKGAAALEAVMENVTFTVPETMVNNVLEARWDNLAHSFGGTKMLEALMKQRGESKEDFLAGMKDDAAEEAKREIVLSAIAEKEDFPVTDEEIYEALGGEDKLANLSEEEKTNYKEYVKESLRIEKVIPFLIENNTFKAAAAEKDKE